jgi:hypothetical protein
MSVFRECCVLSGRGHCDKPITRPEESYRLWCVIVCDVETSRMRRPWPALGCCATETSNMTYSECVYVCSLSYPACKAHAPCYIVICLDVPYFSTLSHKWHDFREILLNMKCVF